MGYKIKRKESIRNAVRRVADEQIGKGIAELDDDALPDPEKVHQLRKRCKKLRGLVRLVRPVAEDLYQLDRSAASALIDELKGDGARR